MASVIQLREHGLVSARAPFSYPRRDRFTRDGRARAREPPRAMQFRLFQSVKTPLEYLRWHGAGIQLFEGHGRDRNGHFSQGRASTVYLSPLEINCNHEFPAGIHFYPKGVLNTDARQRSRGIPSREHVGKRIVVALKSLESSRRQESKKKSQRFRVAVGGGGN